MHMYINNTEQETTLTLSLRDACCVRHLRCSGDKERHSSEDYAAIQQHTSGAWVTKSFYWLQSCTLFTSAFCIWRLLQVCIRSRCYKKICTTKYRLLSESDPQWARGKPNIYIQIMQKKGMKQIYVHVNTIFTKKIDKFFCALWI